MQQYDPIFEPIRVFVYWKFSYFPPFHLHFVSQIQSAGKVRDHFLFTLNSIWASQDLPSQTQRSNGKYIIYGQLSDKSLIAC